MASGKTHDKVGIFLNICTAIALPYPPLILGSFIGWYWLSPDIDLPHSKPSKRMGVLKHMFAPLRAVTSHRGLTHIPVVGTVVMSGWFVVPLYFIGFPEFSILLFLGVLSQNLLHLVLDRLL